MFLPLYLKVLKKWSSTDHQRTAQTFDLWLRWRHLFYYDSTDGIPACVSVTWFRTTSTITNTESHIYSALSNSPTVPLHSSWPMNIDISTVINDGVDSKWLSALVPVEGKVPALTAIGATRNTKGSLEHDS